MKLSIVIVNYNVKYILEQCLHSVYAAMQHVSSEVFVVDNNSVDGSCTMIRERFPWVHLIENKENVGFSRANNQAIRISQGEYVLLLNPDTVVQEDTFLQVINFMDSHPQGGGLGVKMIDGKGTYLHESKRGLPTLGVSFYKMFGFHKIFPHSKKFNYYYLGHLSNTETHEIEILSGAFMLLRKTVLDEVGMLDEEYFMYGEDIDLSYRILKAGHKNYYYPHTTIIHYKGESTKKASFKYVLVFYKAMEIFARKQLNMKKYSFYSLFIHTAIWIRACIALFTRVFKKILFPSIDIAIIYSGFTFLSQWWAAQHFESPSAYPQGFYTILAPLFTLIWICSIYFSAGYERPVKLSNLYKGIISGFLVILLCYSLLPETLRYSRALLLLTFAWNMVMMGAIRYMFHVSKIQNLGIAIAKNKQIILVGDEQETIRVDMFLQETNIQGNIIGYVSFDENLQSSKYIGNINQLPEIIRVYNVNEIIFCLKDLGASQIIQNMLACSHLQVDFKIAPPESFSVIGSNSANTTGEFYTLEINSIAKGLNKRKKRLFDILISLVLLILSIFLLWLIPNKMQFIKNCFKVIFNVNTWVGYSPQLQDLQKKLPPIQTGILYPGIHKQHLAQHIIEQFHIQYVKDYKVRNDLLLILQNIRKLGGNK